MKFVHTNIIAKDWKKLPAWGGRNTNQCVHFLYRLESKKTDGGIGRTGRPAFYSFFIPAFWPLNVIRKERLITIAIRRKRAN